MAASPVPPTQNRRREHPLLGSLPEFRKDRLAFLSALVREQSNVARFRVGPFTVWVFNEPELVHGVLVEHYGAFDKGFVLRNAVRPFSGDGLFISEGDLHRQQRKLMAPAFKPRQIAGYADIMAAIAESAQAGWLDGQPVDIIRELTNITMSIVGKVLLDADVFGEADSLGHSFAAAQRIAGENAINFFYPPLFIPTPRNRETREVIKTIRAYVEGLIAERRAGGRDHGDLLSTLMNARDEEGNAMSDEQVRDQVFTLFAAGHETSTMALAWSFILLAQHPLIYARLRQEVDGALRGRTPTYDDLARMPYTLQVFKESMRLYPPAYVLTRNALRSVVIGGHRVRRTQSVLMLPYLLHRRPDFYPEPERFDPDRFSPENEKKLPRHAYLPFGAGPRVCIGNHFALMEGHILLAAIAQRIAFSLPPGQQIEPELVFTMGPKRGTTLLVRRREQPSA